MRGLLLGLAVLFCGAVLFLVFGMSEAPPPPTGNDRGTETAPGSVTPETSSADPQPANTPTPERPEVADESFEQHLREVLTHADKQASDTLLRDWRSGRLSPEQDRKVWQAIARLPADEVEKAAGRLFLEDELSPAQAEGYASLLATSGTGLAVEYLLAGAQRPLVRAEAVAALATVSELGALPALAEAVRADTAPEVLQALLAALRNMDAAKARDLEAAILEILDP